MSSVLQGRGGLDFNALARGGDKNYSTSFLINLEPDLLKLCAQGVKDTTFDLSKRALINHTKRIMKHVQSRSRRRVQQFTFGSTYIHLNPNYRRFEHMDPITWKKEGIAKEWSGFRGVRRVCCKNCCVDRECNGCKVCRGCLNSPIRGDYDGLVVLTAVTKEILPLVEVVVQGVPNASKRNADRFLDSEHYAFALETSLVNYFMYSDFEWALRCVHSQKLGVGLGECVAVEPEFDGDKKTTFPKKAHAYAVYVAYRLESFTSIRPNASVTLSPSRSSSTAFRKALYGSYGLSKEINADTDMTESQPKESYANQGSGAYEIDDLDDIGISAVDHVHVGEYNGLYAEAPEEEEDEKALEDLDDKQMLVRMSGIETEHSILKEKVWKLEHGRSWIENRMSALETDMNILRTGGKLSPNKPMIPAPAEPSKDIHQDDGIVDSDSNEDFSLDKLAGGKLQIGSKTLEDITEESSLEALKEDNLKVGNFLNGIIEKVEGSEAETKEVAEDVAKDTMKESNDH